jgi:hypothetical protein
VIVPRVGNPLGFYLQRQCRPRVSVQHHRLRGPRVGPPTIPPITAPTTAPGGPAIMAPVPPPIAAPDRVRSCAAATDERVTRVANVRAAQRFFKRSSSSRRPKCAAGNVFREHSRECWLNSGHAKHASAAHDWHDGTDVAGSWLAWNQTRERLMKFFRTALLAASALASATGAFAQMEGSGHGNQGAAQTHPTTKPDPTPGGGGAPANATGTTGQGSSSTTAPADMTPPRPTGETPPQGRAPEQSGSVPGQPGATPD